MRCLPLACTLLCFLFLQDTCWPQQRPGAELKGTSTNQNGGGSIPQIPDDWGVPGDHNKKNVFLIPVSKEASWQEFAYLAAIPASRKLSQDQPSVVALNAFGEVTVEVIDYLKRYEPAHTFLVGQEAEWSQGHWLLDEGSGATALDRSTFQHHGVIQGAAWVNGELFFDGIDDHVVMPGYKGLLGTAGRSTAAWIKTTEKNGEILSWGQFGLPGACWVMGLDDRGALSLYAGDVLANGSTVLNDGKWHHVAAVLDGQSQPVIGNVKFFIDGETEQISKVWDNASGSLKNNLIGYWRMEEGSGITLADSSQGGNSGTCHSDFAAGGDYPDWGAGLLGTGLYFDNNDYIEIENETYFDGTALAFSVSCWVKHNWVWGVGGNDQFVTKANKYESGWELGRAYDSNLGKVSAKKKDAESGAISPVDVWHHVVGVYDGNVLSYHVDGLKRDQTVVGGIGANDTAVRIGCGSYGGSPSGSGPVGGRYKGWIDEVAVWDRALTDNEIGELYNNGSGVVIDTTSTPLNTQAGSDVKIGMFDGTYLYYNGAVEDVRIYDRALTEKEVASLKERRDQNHDSFTPVPGNSLDEVACNLAGLAWTEAGQVVVCREDDYSNALAAAALAARMEAPLLYYQESTGLSPEGLSKISGLTVFSAFIVGGNATVQSQLAGMGIACQTLSDASEILAWMESNGLKVDYFAAVNPQDRDTGRAPKASLAGALLAAGREGAVIHLDHATDWKHPFWYSQVVDVQPLGAPVSKTGFWYLGSLNLGVNDYDFVISNTQNHEYYDELYIDFNQDNDFSGLGEGPFESADEVVIDGKRWSLSVGTHNSQTPGHIKFTYPCLTEMRADLLDYCATLGRHPEYLCVLGLPEAIPFAIMDGKIGYDNMEDIPTDAPLGDLDDDPFFEMAVGRVLGENLSYGTLLASRSLTYPHLIHDPDTWARRSVWVGTFWEDKFMTPHKLMNGGFLRTQVFENDPGLDKSAVSVIIQDDHGGCGGFGTGWDFDLEELLAPCVIDLAGCDTGGIDQDSLDRLGAIRMLRKGGILFMGDKRAATADLTKMRQEFWNQALTGATLGQAFRHALNMMMLHYMEWSTSTAIYDLYELRNESFYGDPALKIYVPHEPALEPAHIEADGALLTVVAPEDYWINAVPASSHHVYAGPGLHPSYETDVKYFFAAWRTDQVITGMSEEPGVPSPLGWPNDKWFVDEHQDGTRSIYWSVRFVQFDKNTGQIVKEKDKIEYTVRF